MRTQFRAEQLLDPHLKDAERQLRTCVHCGFCTATCPTYLVLGDERDSPRGRIMLIQHMLESEAPPTPETVKHLDQCLSCLGCRTACPSGVNYAALIDEARAHIERHYTRPFPERLFRSFLLFMLTRPQLFAMASRVARITAPLLSWLPGKLGAMIKKAATDYRAAATSAPIPPTSPTARRVLLFPGCVQRALAPGIDAAATRVLARADIRTETLSDTGCCGALAFHLGKDVAGKDSARRIIEAYEAARAKGDVDAVLITASGCTSFLKDYGRVFAGEPDWQTRAEAFAAEVKDFTELAEVTSRATVGGDLTIAFHPPCTLQHGQKINGRGEALLTAAGFRLAPIPDAHLCCGSAGSYSLLQPQIAAELRARKLASIRLTGAGLIASANIGCLAHLAGELPVAHIAELLDWAAGGPKPDLNGARAPNATPSRVPIPESSSVRA
jgi:glycolate oxidase iron-sulfur subunit